MRNEQIFIHLAVTFQLDHRLAVRVNQLHQIRIGSGVKSRSPSRLSLKSLPSRGILLLLKVRKSTHSHTESGESQPVKVDTGTGGPVQHLARSCGLFFMAYKSSLESPFHIQQGSKTDRT